MVWQGSQRNNLVMDFFVVSIHINIHSMPRGWNSKQVVEKDLWIASHSTDSFCSIFLCISCIFLCYSDKECYVLSAHIHMALPMFSCHCMYSYIHIHSPRIIPPSVPVLTILFICPIEFFSFFSEHCKIL